jgi:ribosomal protein L24E
MPVCSFCRRNFKEPRGLTVFTFDGRAIHYCCSKCRKNAALGRDGRKVNWVRKSGVSFGEEAEEQKQEKE